MVPGKPGQPTAIGRQPRRGKEVVTGGEHLAGIGSGAGGVDAYDGVHWLVSRLRMVFANADPAAAPRVEKAIAVSPGALGCKRHGLGGAAVQAIEAVVGIVRKIESACRDEPGAPSVLVNAGAHVERRRRDVFRRPVRSLAHHYIAAGLLRTHFDPVDIVAIHPDFGKADGLGDDQVGGDGGLPGAVRSGAHYSAV